MKLMKKLTTRFYSRETVTMGRMIVKSWPDEKLEHVIVQLEEDGKPLAHVPLDAATTEQHIHDLARHRAALKEGVTPDLDPGARLEAVFDPTWRIPGEHPPRGKGLALRHPGLGWLSFVFPHKKATAIAEWLTKDAPPRPEA